MNPSFSVDSTMLQHARMSFGTYRRALISVWLFLVIFGLKICGATRHEEVCVPLAKEDLDFVTLSEPVVEHTVAFSRFFTVRGCVDSKVFGNSVVSVVPYNQSQVQSTGYNFLLSHCYSRGCIDRDTFSFVQPQSNYTSNVAVSEHGLIFDVPCATSRCLTASASCFALPSCSQAMAESVRTGILSDEASPSNPAIWDAILPSLSCYDIMCGGNLTAAATAWASSNSTRSRIGNRGVRYINLVSTGIKELPATVFRDVRTTLTEVDLSLNLINDLPSGLLTNITSLAFFKVTANQLTCIDRCTFESQTNLRQLWLDQNLITAIATEAFSTLFSLEVLVLSKNFLPMIPVAVRSVPQLQELLLRENSLTVINRNDFLGLTNLKLLALDGNKNLVEVDTAAFTSLERLSVPRNAFNTSMSISLGIDVRMPENDNASFLGEPSAIPPIILNGAPISCRQNGTLISDITCDSCHFGYEANASKSCMHCVLPAFRPWHHWDPATLATAVPENVHHHAGIHVPPPDLNPRKERFFGYAGSDFNAIRYRLSFPTSVDLQCGSTMSRDTSSLQPTHLNNTEFNWLYRHKDRGFVDRPVYLNLEVLSEGMFTFDSCDSLTPASMTLYRGKIAFEDNPSFALMIEPNVLPESILVKMRSRFPGILNWSSVPRRQMPWTSGCALSSSARRQLRLTPGKYTLQVMGHPYFNDRGGEFTIKMDCSDGATTVLSTNNPGGITVNERTGEVTGIPKRHGMNYKMVLSAVDKSGAVALISNWTFNVMHYSFSTRPGWNDGLDPGRNLVSQYHVGELALLLPPTGTKDTIFDHPSHWDYNSIVYLINVHRTGNLSLPLYARVPCTQDSASSQLSLVDSAVGGGAMRFTCTGMYNATITGRDTTGAEVVVSQWSFVVRQADIDVPEYGPGGQECVNGFAVDDVAMDENFTCKCFSSQFSGPNCDILISQSTGVEKDVHNAVYIIASVIVTLLVFVIVALREHRRKRRLPFDFSEQISQLHSNGIITKFDSLLPHTARVPKELSRQAIQVGDDVIGKGNFGEVFCGELAVSTNKILPVAIKVCLDDTAKNRADFVREAAVSWQFKHRNVVKMHGVVTTGTPYFLVMELCHHGALQKFLTVNDHDLGENALLSFLTDIACGMTHLVSCGFVHRDLAARNVLVDAGFHAKVADFGLGRDLEDSDFYESCSDSMLLPLRWTDPHALDSGKFSERTDVWAFGVTAIEVYTKGALPYRGWTNAYVIEQTRSGYRLPCPAQCPAAVYNLVIHPCWNVDSRPTFSAIYGALRGNMVPSIRQERSDAHDCTKASSLGKDDQPLQISSYTLLEHKRSELLRSRSLVQESSVGGDKIGQQALSGQEHSNPEQQMRANDSILRNSSEELTLPHIYEYDCVISKNSPWKFDGASQIKFAAPEAVRPHTLTADSRLIVNNRLMVSPTKLPMETSGSMHTSSPRASDSDVLPTGRVQSSIVRAVSSKKSATML